MLNLEGNGIESWDELAGFRNLDNFGRLIVNKNRIPEIYYKPGFRGLQYLSFEDNLITNWKSFDALNEFDARMHTIRCAGNPITTEQESEEDKQAKMKGAGTSQTDFVSAPAKRAK